MGELFLINQQYCVKSTACSVHWYQYKMSINNLSRQGSNSQTFPLFFTWIIHRFNHSMEYLRAFLRRTNYPSARLIFSVIPSTGSRVRLLTLPAGAAWTRAPKPPKPSGGDEGGEEGERRGGRAPPHSRRGAGMSCGSLPSFVRLNGPRSAADWPRPAHRGTTGRAGGWKSGESERGAFFFCWRHFSAARLFVLRVPALLPPHPKLPPSPG